MCERKPLHAEETFIFCNRCRKLVHKIDDTYPNADLNHDVHCLKCDNWLGGYFDIYGHEPEGNGEKCPKCGSQNTETKGDHSYCNACHFYWGAWVTA
jgi:hypothetical protein